MTRNKNGIPNLTRSYFAEMKKGCNSANCPPLELSTSSAHEARTGVTLGKLREIALSVKGASVQM